MSDHDVEVRTLDSPKNKLEKLQDNIIDSTDEEGSPVKRKRMKYNEEILNHDDDSLTPKKLQKEDTFVSPQKSNSENQLPEFKTPEKVVVTVKTNSCEKSYSKDKINKPAEVTPTKDDVITTPEITVDNLSKEEESPLITETEQARDLMLSLSGKKITPVKHHATPTKNSMSSPSSSGKTPNGKTPGKRVPLTTIASPKPKKSNKSLF